MAGVVVGRAVVHDHDLEIRIVLREVDRTAASMSRLRRARG
jgi:hypothetical protein